MSRSKSPRWYRSLTPDGKVWCESSNAAEVLERSYGEGFTFQVLVCTVTESWEPWEVRDADLSAL